MKKPKVDTYRILWHNDGLVYIRLNSTGEFFVYGKQTCEEIRDSYTINKLLRKA